jgi:uncharacterized protein HemX
VEPDEPEPLARPDCELDQDGRIWITPGVAARLRDCNIPEGAILSFGYQVERRPSKRAKRKEKPKVEPTTTEPTIAAPSASSTNTETPVVHHVSGKDAVVAQVVDDAAAIPAPVAASPEAVVEQPAAPALDPMAVAQENPMLALGLAVLAVVGGGAGFKLWTKMSEQKHEEKLKLLDLEAQKAGLNGAQPPPCQVKQAEVDAKLAALETRLGKMEKRSSGLPTDFDGEELEKRVGKVEAAIKRIGLKPPAGGGK